MKLYSALKFVALVALVAGCDVGPDSIHVGPPPDRDDASAEGEGGPPPRLLADGEICTRTGQCLHGGCILWYRDADGDGFGSVLSSAFLCGEDAPPGYASNKNDCCDIDAVATPLQTSFVRATNACGSRDWNCDGSVDSYDSGWR